MKVVRGYNGTYQEELAIPELEITSAVDYSYQHHSMFW